MTDITLTIGGMSCQHCVAAVKNSIDSLEGVESSEVTVGSANVSYDESKTSKETIIDTVTKSGYTIA